MTEVTGKYFLTIAPVDNEVFHISDTALRKVDILNDTDQVIWVSDNGEFTTDADGISDFIAIPSGIAVNGIHIAGVGLYIKSFTADGDIVVMGAA